MKRSGFRAWKVAGGLAAAAMLSVGCGYLPDTGGTRPDDPPKDFFGGRVGRNTEAFYDQHHYSANRGYNGTIQQLGSSIDPRTPETTGQLGNSRLVDVAGRPAPEAPELGIGGSGGVIQVGDPDGSADRGWRARRGYEVEPGRIGSVGSAPQSGHIPGP